MIKNNKALHCYKQEKKCNRCGRIFKANSVSQKWCKNCYKERELERLEYLKKRRIETDKKEMAGNYR